MHQQLSRRPALLLPLYFGATYLWSWAFWIPAVRAWRAGPQTPEHLMALLPFVLAGAYGPTIAALVLSGVVEGWSGVRALLARLLVWRVRPLWYLFALLLPPALVLVGLALFVWRGGWVGPVDPNGLVLVAPTLVGALPFGPLAEELGWRGYALPRLLDRVTPTVASLIVGAAWTFWHTPLFFAPSGTSISGRPVTLTAVATYFAFVTGLSFVFTFMATRTKGSVLLAVLLHLAINGALVFLFFPAIRQTAGNFGMSDAQREIFNLAIIPLWVFVLLIAMRSRTRKTAI
jgi:membrane protease YdiL (CAAX protease family)